MKRWNSLTASRLPLVVGIAVVLGVGYTGSKLAFASVAASARRSASQPGTQRPASPATTETPAPQPSTIDDEDRVAGLWYFQRVSKSGWQRGMEIYYMRCYMCHNKYTIAAEGRTAAPTLRDLYKRRTEEDVVAQIRNGSARMPAYSPVYMSDADLADLLAYLRDKCCVDENNPPPNPRYRAQ